MLCLAVTTADEFCSSRITILGEPAYHAPMRIRPIQLMALGTIAATLSCSKPTSPMSRPAVQVTPDYAAFPDRSPTLMATGPSGDDIPFYPGAEYSTDLPTPEGCLGHPLGARMAKPEAIVGCFQAWAESSSRVVVEPYARSYEGRPLVRAVISSPANLARLEAILTDMARLADPRGLSAGDIERISAELPAIGWFGYSVHGDEVSGADASLAFGHYLIAGTNPEVAQILDRAIIVIDPVQNPDGRARIIARVDENASSVPNLDDTSMSRGSWPYGRGNHYLFDMNRDWIVGVAPETRGRWQGILRYRPLLVVDAHEMGPRDTYLFYPYADPINPNMAATLVAWQRVFAVDHSRAFDRYGWAYYTREWADGWFPGYTDGWNSLTGAIGILYEQATSSGQDVLRPTGQRDTYRRTVHSQAVSSLTNLRTLVANHKEILRDYVRFKQSQIQGDGNARTFVLRPGRNPDRERRFVAMLMRQGIEMYQADRDFRAANGVSALGGDEGRLTLPAGSYLIPSNQAQGALVAAILQFDTRFDQSYLNKERAHLERKGRSKIFDLTAWSLGHAFGLDVYWVDSPQVPSTRMTEIPRLDAQSTEVKPAYAWVVDSRDDGSAAFIAQGLERGLVMHAGDAAFDVGGRTMGPGSIIIRAGDNGEGAAEKVHEAAKAAQVPVIAAGTGLSSTDGPDLGGRHFHRIHQPRVAVLSNAPVSASDYGHIWHQIDREMTLSMTMLNAQSLGFYDLRRYNVIIVPPAGPQLKALLSAYKDKLTAWVRSGGSLIAVGSSAAVMADKNLGLSRVRLRRDVLKELPLYRDIAARDLASLFSGEVQVDSSVVWEAPAAPGGEAEKGKEPSTAGPETANMALSGTPEVVAQRDAWMRRFAPRGAILRGMVNRDHWLTFGVGDDELSVLIYGDPVFLAPASVSVPVRLAPASRLRLAGLLWPEARERLGASAYATVERMGSGQVILFAGPPSFRGMFAGTARLLTNAIVYGPSMGASQVVGW